MMTNIWPGPYTTLQSVRYQYWSHDDPSYAAFIHRVCTWNVSDPHTNHTLIVITVWYCLHYHVNTSNSLIEQSAGFEGVKKKKNNPNCLCFTYCTLTQPWTFVSLFATRRLQQNCSRKYAWAFSLSGPTERSTISIFLLVHSQTTP